MCEKRLFVRQLRDDGDYTETDENIAMISTHNDCNVRYSSDGNSVVIRTFFFQNLSRLFGQLCMF